LADRNISYPKKVFVVPEPVKISAAEWQGAKILGDRIQQALG
jgi:hypothetical protein